MTREARGEVRTRYARQGEDKRGKIRGEDKIRKARRGQERRGEDKIG